MAQILSMGTKSKNYCVARMNFDTPQYLKRVGAAYAWGDDIADAIQFPNEIEAAAIATRCMGGAQVAEMVAV